MLSASKEKLQTFYSSNYQFKIPFFQRAYVWKQENWIELWENITELLQEEKAGSVDSEHFIGTVIIKQTDQGKLNTIVFDLIDGQQRLTTISLLLRALHDSSTDKYLKSWILDKLCFRDSYGQPHIRIIHSKVDRQYFTDLITSDTDNESLPNSSNQIVGAYSFFKERVSKEIKEDDIRSVVNIVLERLPVIHMALSANDDVQQIFDTINSLGVKLTAGELLKNFLFASKELEPKYETYWQNVFEADEYAVKFWNKDKTSGRIVRSTIELFLYSFLVIKKESIIRIETLFKEFKQYLKDKSSDELIAFAKELNEYARLYEGLPEGEDLADISFNEYEKRFFHIMNELDITTVFPLVLFIYKNVTDVNEKREILQSLESYLVRRNICKLTTKNYNNLFISILTDLKKSGSFTAVDFNNKLLSYTEDTNRFPDDQELERAFHNLQLLNKYAKEILYCISLYHLDHDYQDNRRLSNYGFTVEHVMPKKWRNKWRLLIGSTEPVWDAKLLTLGNLTLVKGRLNSSMRDAAWENKKKTLTDYSTLKITTKYLAEPQWDEKVISRRADDLFTTAKSVWKR